MFFSVFFSDAELIFVTTAATGSRVKCNDAILFITARKLGRVNFFDKYQVCSNGTKYFPSPP